MENEKNSTLEQELFELQGTKFVDEFSKEIYEQTYRYGNETIDETQHRVAKDLARIEKDQEFWTNQFQWALENFKFVPGGRITSNAGTGLKGTSYINCFVSGFEGTHQDSMKGIMAELQRQAMILKSEGGYGFCANVMRPRGGFVEGIGNETPGAVRMLDMWDTQSAVITAGSGQKTKKEKAKIKIRKGAQMVTMSCWHPDIEEFITAKQTPGRLTKFNMSVLITDEFMDAVENNKSWNLVFPDFDSIKDKYDAEWNGDLKEWQSKGYPIKVYKTFDNANELWNMIIQSTYNRNEPGVLFIDVINRLNNLYYSEKIDSTNPCCAKGTLVNTPDGYRPIEDLRVGDSICTVIGEEKIDEIEHHLNYPTYKVTFSDGGEQIVTEDHQYHVNRKLPGKKMFTKKIETIKLKDINLGDRVRVEPSKLSSYEFDEIDYHIGLKAGILIGDGCYTDLSLKNRIIKIASNKEDNSYNKNLKKLFGENNCRKDDVSFNSKSMSIVMNSDLIDLKLLGINPNYSEDKYFDISKAKNYSYIVGILDGLLSTDGNINFKTNNPQIRFFTSSKKLAQQIRSILLYLDCHGRITSSFNQDGGEINNRKIIRKNRRYVVTLTGGSVKSFFKHTKIENIHPVKYSFLKEMVCKSRLTGNNWDAEVVKIEKHENIDVYDLYCKGSDTWITEGYVQRGCGEQLLPHGGVCLLGSLNLTQFINEQSNDWDYKKLSKIVPIAIRFMDNVNDITYVPLDLQKENLKNKRRIGLGVMGYGSALMMMKIRYGSPEALKLTEKLEKFIANAAYQASSNIAVEKGSFPLFDVEKYLNGNFVKNLSEETLALIKIQGLRNSHLLSIQPTGNSSIFANVVSGGLEPVFLPVYVRTSMMPYPPEGLYIPKNVDWVNKTYISDTDWVWIKEGDDNLLKTEFDGYIWKFDRDRGLLRETIVKDYAVRFLESKGEWDASSDWAATTTQLSVDEHVNTMKIFAKYVDSAISKTTNLPFDYPYEDFKDTYLKAYKTGTIKGFTTYRAGTMTEVLGAVDKPKEDVDGKPLRIVKTTAPKRPKTLPCDIYNVTANGEKWIVLIGLLDGDPYEVFAFKPKTEGLHLPVRLKDGYLTKIKKGRYDLQCEGGITIEDLSQHFETTEQEALTRLISAALRHGSDSKFIMEQLNKSEGTIVSFSKAIARTLKKYIPEDSNTGESCPSCGEKALVYQEGCMVCLNCSSSKCG